MELKSISATTSLGYKSCHLGTFQTLGRCEDYQTQATVTYDATEWCYSTGSQLKAWPFLINWALAGDDHWLEERLIWGSFKAHKRLTSWLACLLRVTGTFPLLATKLGRQLAIDAPGVPRTKVSHRS